MRYNICSRCCLESMESTINICPHWFVDKDLAMSMCIFLDYNGKNIISYTGGTQWWCTAFNADYIGVLAFQLKATFRVRFNDPGMYYAFREKWGSKGWDCYDKWLIAYYTF